MEENFVNFVVNIARTHVTLIARYDNTICTCAHS